MAPAQLNAQPEADRRTRAASSQGRDARDFLAGGLPCRAALADVLAEMGIEDAEIDRVVFPGGRPPKFARPRNCRPRSDRAVRFARIVKFAEQVFDNHRKAFLWLRTPSQALMGQAPIACIGTETGAKAVEELLSRIDFGMAA
ncbi:MAG: DUF2384 domain-containing protein [Alphaproteobacteria bacterium]|nr:DUF2384 domain-containing protein [Alphaproteobacteria bacterium]